jgi:hypothetical protein
MKGPCYNTLKNFNRFEMKKITVSPLMHKLVFTLLVNIGMALSMSLSMHIINIGLHSFATIWFKNFFISMVIGFPIALLLVTLVSRVLAYFFTVHQ